MQLVSLAEHGWIGIVVLVLIFLRREIKMMAMRLVFRLYRTSRRDQNKWLMREARRNDRLTLARGFWNRASQRRPNPPSSPRRLTSSRRPKSASVSELSGDAREPRAPAA